uniref:Uncharacterized protein n=1 Tax=Aegilops tauschii TaxID=37682 RepID=M8C6Y0_AEGTA
MADEKAATEKALTTVTADETVEQEEEKDFDKLYEEAKAEYAQLMDKFLGADPPMVKLVINIPRVCGIQVFSEYLYH